MKKARSVWPEASPPGSTADRRSMPSGSAEGRLTSPAASEARDCFHDLPGLPDAAPRMGAPGAFRRGCSLECKHLQISRHKRPLQVAFSNGAGPPIGHLVLTGDCRPAAISARFHRLQIAETACCCVGSIDLIEHNELN